jgi:NTP pyrophosphatase (non-canonical NTP hydrolase)
VTDQIWRAVEESRAWLDRTNGVNIHQQTFRILKVTEEAGEAAGAWIGVVGNNPRKGVTHTVDDVVAELADVALAALVAIHSLDQDARTVLEQCATKVLARLDQSHPSTTP